MSVGNTAACRASRRFFMPSVRIRVVGVYHDDQSKYALSNLRSRDAYIYGNRLISDGKCAHCPVKDGPCVVESGRFPAFCEWAASGDPVKLRTIVERSARGDAQPSLPSVATMAGNLARGAARHVLHGLPRADAATLKARLDTCRACDQLRDDNRCAACGCDVNRKAAWLGERCPLDRWPKDETS